MGLHGQKNVEKPILSPVRLPFRHTGNRYLSMMVRQCSALRSKSPASVCQKVFDSRKRRVRLLWQRNGRFFANLMAADQRMNQIHIFPCSKESF